MKRFLLIFTMLLCGYCSPVFADSVYEGNVRAKLICDVSTIAPDQSFWIGLHMAMDEGWHTYWQNPGDSGMATDIEWELPDGFTAGALHWPYPKRFDYYEGLTSYGHEGTIALLAEIKTPENLNPGEAYAIHAKARWLSCEKICVPGKADLSIVLEAQDGTARINTEAQQFFANERKRWPVGQSQWQVTAIDRKDQFLLNITLNGDAPESLSELAFYPLRNDIVDHAGKQIFKESENGYSLALPKSRLIDGPVSTIDGVLVSPQGWLQGGTRHSLLVNTSVGP